MSFADIQKDRPAALIPRTAEALIAETPAPATRIIRDAEAHAYALPAPANQTAAPDALRGWSAWLSIPLGRGRRIGIAAHPRAERAVNVIAPSRRYPRPEQALNNPQAFARAEVADWWTVTRDFIRRFL